MILVAVGDHKSFDLGNIFLQICYIRDDQIDSEHIVLRESKTTVYDDDTVLILKTVMFIPICSRPPSGIIFNLLPLFFFK